MNVIHPRQKCLCWALGLALLVSPVSASNERAIIEENQGKALLIYNIAKFTVWPPTMVAEDEPFVFTLWNDASLAESFQIIDGQHTQGRTIQVQRHNKDSLPEDCEVLIIPKRQLQRFIKAQKQLNAQPILTVTTDPKVFKAGAMVLVEVVEDHLSFSVNLERVKASELEISGNLLRHAKEVHF